MSRWAGYVNTSMQIFNQTWFRLLLAKRNVVLLWHLLFLLHTLPSHCPSPKAKTFWVVKAHATQVIPFCELHVCKTSHWKPWASKSWIYLEDKFIVKMVTQPAVEKTGRLAEILYHRPENSTDSLIKWWISSFWQKCDIWARGRIYKGQCRVNRAEPATSPSSVTACLSAEQPIPHNLALR